MGLKGKMRRLERAATEKLESLELEDRSRYYYDAMEAGIGVFLHTTERLRSHDQPEWPEPPEIIKALARAKNRKAAFDRFLAGALSSFPTTRRRSSSAVS
jgi:hypothetical protein